MSEQYPGGFVTKSPPTPQGNLAVSSAQGMWNLSQQAAYKAQGLWPDPNNTADAQFNYVTMLLHGDGTNGAANNTFLDGSSFNATVTRNGNATQGSFSPYGSNWSNYFGGSNSGLSIPSNTAFDFPGDFTIEGWVCINSKNSATLISRTTGAGNHEFWIGWDGASLTVFYNGANAFYPTDSFVVNQWQHYALVRSGSSIVFYINGVSSGSSSNSASWSSSAAVTVGYAGALSGYGMDGYQSNVRIVKGTAVYTSNFTPSTAPLTAISGTSLLTCQSNRFIDNSASPKTITSTGTTSVQRFNPFGASTAYSTATIGGSAYLDGTGDYLQIADGTQFTLGTSNYTMEMWVYPTSFAAQVVPFAYQWSSSGGTRLIAWIQNINATISGYYNNAGNSFSTTNTVKLNAWNHLALVRNGDVFTFYINGVSSWTASNAITYSDSTYPVNIGASWDGSTGTIPYPGYISDARVVIGTAIYTAEFTPPTAPLTAVANTKLLCNMTNGAIYDNAMANDLETAGSVQITTSVKKYGTGSIQFPNGTSGDYLSFRNNGSGAFGTGNFTVEMWINNSTTSGNRAPIGYTAGSWALVFLNTTLYWVSVYSSVNLLSTSSAAIQDGNWHHLAICRSGTTTRMFFDGVQATSATDTTNYNDYLYPLQVGGAGTGYGNYLGYIDDLRITKGYARYTTTFTPPSSAFSNIGPT